MTLARADRYVVVPYEGRPEPPKGLYWRYAERICSDGQARAHREWAEGLPEAIRDMDMTSGEGERQYVRDMEGLHRALRARAAAEGLGGMELFCYVPEVYSERGGSPGTEGEL